VLGPILFVLYIVDLIQLVESDGLLLHLYAYDVQLYGSCSPAAVDALSKLARMELMFIDTGMNINDAYYREVFVTQKLLSVVWEIYMPSF